MLFLKYMIGVYIAVAVLVLIAAGSVFGIYESRYKADLLSGGETEKARYRKA